MSFLFCNWLIDMLKKLFERWRRKEILQVMKKNIRENVHLNNIQITTCLLSVCLFCWFSSEELCIQYKQMQRGNRMLLFLLWLSVPVFVQNQDVKNTSTGCRSDVGLMKICYLSEFYAVIKNTPRHFNRSI